MLFSKRQSAYRQGHSAETALVDVLVSVYTAADNKEITVLIGLDLSAAFDTVCHSTLTQRLQTEFGLSVLAACTTDVKQWYLQNVLQLNPDKSEVLPMGTAYQRSHL